MRQHKISVILSETPATPRGGSVLLCGGKNLKSEILFRHTAWADPSTVVWRRLRRKMTILLGIFIISLLGCGKGPQDPAGDPWGIEGKIAFGTSRGEGVYNVAVYEKGKITLVTRGGSFPVWGSKGEKLLTHYGQGLGIYDLTTGNTEKINVPVRASHHTWYPDESGILLTGHDPEIGSENSPRNLYKYDFQTKSWKQLTPYQNKERFYSFAFFRDGKRILCSFAKDPSLTGDRGTYIMNLETLEMKKLNDKAGDYVLLPHEKAFIANTGVWKGERLISQSEMYLVDLETGKETLLTKTGKIKSRPSVSPDGQKVIYSAYVEDGERIFVLDIKSKKEREVFDRPIEHDDVVVHDRDPDWIA